MVQIVEHPNRQMRPALGGFQNQFQRISSRAFKAVIELESPRFARRDKGEVFEMWFGIESTGPRNLGLAVSIFEQTDRFSKMQLLRIQIFKNVDELI